ncbi:OmpA family protein [Flavobacterium cyclinae]|uniref:OmpA family protein n=1 Tax=Flavobacterium cyclinae TaxID=2895947 RepID=UPI001E59B03C|nr:OmpA family protein [Flavobacterium cyclinae]UGS20615.1 OmpA family protein [Flavobacterium cyclinae]
MNLLKKYFVFSSILVFSLGIAQEQKDSETRPEKKEAVETTDSEKRDSVYIPNKVINKTVSDTVHPKDREKNYNRWSVNLNVGTNIGIRPFTDGYYATTPNYFTKPEFNHFDLNVRRMFNTKFGVMWDFGYDNFTADSGSPDFSNNMYRTSFQGVMNIHRAFNWEEFTETFGLQLHLGPGFSFLEAPETSTFNHYDNLFSIIGGATALIKISDKLAFNLDFTMISNLTHHVTLDGQTRLDPSLSRTGTVYTTSFGATFYFGKKERHADWYWENLNVKDEYQDLLARVEELETMMNDTDRDGVPDYLDVENNTIGGVAVDTKGRAIDLNNNGVPDELERYINNKYGDMQTVINNMASGEYSSAQMKQMINGQYVNVFFDFDDTRITTGTISAINFLIKYLNANPTANAEVIGYADEMGDANYNIALSRKRAQRVMEMLVRSGIDPNRLKLVVKGADNSVPKDSKLARQLVRRVVFKVD